MADAVCPAWLMQGPIGLVIWYLQRFRAVVDVDWWVFHPCSAPFHLLKAPVQEVRMRLERMALFALSLEVQHRRESMVDLSWFDPACWARAKAKFQGADLGLLLAAARGSTWGGSTLCHAGARESPERPFLPLPQGRVGPLVGLSGL